jgi:type IV pilus assembly protein PilW
MYSFDHKLRSPGHRHSQAGMSLVELMISITIGLLLLAGVTALIAAQSSARKELDNAGRQIENGRYAAQLLQEDIQLAGYYGEYASAGTAPVSLPDPCATDTASLLTAVPLPIQGYDSPTTVPSPLNTSACLPNANHLPGTDILVIRRTDTTTLPIASAVVGQVYLQSGLMPPSPNFDFVLGNGSDTSVFKLKKKNGTTASDLRNYLVHIYFVSPCNVPATGTTCNGSSDDNGRPIPTLKRLDLTVTGGAATFSTVPLVEGIENLQLDYGVDTTNDGSPDSYTTAPTVADWANVMSIRVNLLARSNDTSPGYTSNKQYSLGAAGTVGPFTDNYKRHVFSQLIRVINPSGRREL